MSLQNFFSNTFNINMYFDNTYKNNKKKEFDIESQKYEICDLVIIDKKNKLKYDKYNNIWENAAMDKEILIPTGIGFDRSTNLEWRRKTNQSDYEVIYKGFHTIPYKIIEKIIYAHNGEKYTSLENILKLYIDNGFNVEQTIIYLHL